MSCPSADLGPCIAPRLGVIGSFAFASVCGAAVFFMLVFLRALLREVVSPPIQFTERRERITVTPVSIGIIPGTWTGQRDFAYSRDALFPVRQSDIESAKFGCTV